MNVASPLVGDAIRAASGSERIRRIVSLPLDALKSTAHKGRRYVVQKALLWLLGIEHWARYEGLVCRKVMTVGLTMEHQVVERMIAGRKLRIETGKVAKQAAGAVVVSYADTVVLAAVITGPPREGIDFFPLTVDYREKTYAAGKFPGGFFQREARPTQKEILTMRMIDRPVRPLFPNEFRDEVLIQAMVLATDQENEPDVLAMLGASAALCVSPLPFDGT